MVTKINGHNNLEIAISALIEHKSGDAIKALEAEITEAKRKGHHNVVTRLRTLVSRVPASSTMGAASASRQKVVKLDFKDNDLYTRLEPRYALADVILPSSTKQTIGDFLNEWEHFDTLASHNIFPINKLLLYGPPGTGKTKLAHALAHQLDMPLVLVRLDELISSYLGKTGKNIRQIFELAENEKVILFLDEIDTIAKNRADSQDLGELKRVVTVLLQNIDMLSTHSIVIGATNHEDILDKAIWRRFPQKIQLTLPDKTSRRNMINLFLGDQVKDIDIDQIVSLTDGLSGSVIKDFCDHLLKQSIISSQKVDRTTSLRTLLLVLGKEMAYTKKGHKDRFYKIAKDLYGKGYSLRDIETISGIAYTTLREHLV